MPNRYSIQDTEDAQQDYVLELLTLNCPFPEAACITRIRNIRCRNSLKGTRMGSWSTGTLKYATITSFDALQEEGKSFISNDDLISRLEDLLILNKIESLCSEDELQLLRSYLKHDGSPGLMSAEYQCSPQYINRLVNRLTSNIGKRLKLYEY